jgi:hypothetical protein
VSKSFLLSFSLSFSFSLFLCFSLFLSLSHFHSLSISLSLSLSLFLPLPYGGKKFNYLILINAEKISPPPPLKKKNLIDINLTPAEEEKYENKTKNGLLLHTFGDWTFI